MADDVTQGVYHRVHFFEGQGRRFTVRIRSDRHLAFPTITLHGEVHRAQRYTAESIATIRYQLTVRLVATLDVCPRCRSPARKFDLMTQQDF